MAKSLMAAFGIPNLGCPVGNTTFCYSEKDNIQLTSARRIVGLYEGKQVVEAVIKHSMVNDAETFCQKMIIDC